MAGDLDDRKAENEASREFHSRMNAFESARQVMTMLGTKIKRDQEEEHIYKLSLTILKYQLVDLAKAMKAEIDAEAAAK